MILIDKTSFEKLFHDYYEVLCNFAFSTLSDREASEDIVQEVFVNIWHHKDDIEVRTNLRNYLFTSVRNKAIERLRRLKLEQKYKNTITNIDDNPFDDYENEIERMLIVNKLYHSIDKLPDRCRQIFKMAKIEGMTYQQIADDISLSVKTIESQMRRAFILLREMMIEK